MLKQKNETYEDYEKRMKRRAEILFPNTIEKNKNDKTQQKNLPLGKSNYDIYSGLPKGIEKVKSDLDPLVEAIEREKNLKHKSRKDMTLEEQEKYLDDFYPTMAKPKTLKQDEMKIPETLDKSGTNSFEKEENTKDLSQKIKEHSNDTKEKHYQIPTTLLKTSIEKSDLKLSDQNFIKSMDVVFENEGGFSNHKNDKGGRTNMGITQKTYDDYCKRHGLEKKDVKNLTKEEAVEVYYNDYWKASGADKIDNKTDALILFDTAVLHGVGKAKQFYKQANGNSDKILELRKEHYLKKVKADSSQNDFLKGWNNRVNKLDKILKESKK